MQIIEAVSDVYGVQPVFVWQPSPTCKYDLDNHLFVGDILRRHDTNGGYIRMGEIAGTRSIGDNFLWCADLQEEMQKPFTLIRSTTRATCPSSSRGASRSR